MLKELRRWVVAFAVVSAVTVPVAYGSVAHTPSPVGTMGYIQLDNSELIAPDLMRAFVPTGSTDQRCLVTFSETTIDSIGPAPFCGARTVNGVHGLLISINLEQVQDVGVGAVPHDVEHQTAGLVLLRAKGVGRELSLAPPRREIASPSSLIVQPRSPSTRAPRSIQRDRQPRSPQG